jgi:hypothetical protein
MKRTKVSKSTTTTKQLAEAWGDEPGAREPYPPAFQDPALRFIASAVYEESSTRGCRGVAFRVRSLPPDDVDPLTARAWAKGAAQRGGVEWVYVDKRGVRPLTPVEALVELGTIHAGVYEGALEPSANLPGPGGELWSYGDAALGFALLSEQLRRNGKPGAMELPK